MIENAENRVSYKGDGKATEFAIPFSFIDKEDVVVVIVDPEYRETTLEKDYFVDMEKKTVLYPGYPPGEEPPESEKPQVLPAGWKIVIYRDIDVTQEESLGDLWPFNLIEKGLDKLTMICQDLFYSLRRSVKLSAGASDDFDPQLPALKPGQSIAMNETGTGFRATRSPEDATDTAVSSAAAAAASEAASADSEKNAAASEAAAASSEANASESENMAKRWATATDSPDGNKDEESVTGETMSAREWALYAKQIATSMGDPVVSVTEETGVVTVTKSSGEQNQFYSGLNILQRNKEYEVGDIAYSPNLKSYQYLECITAGTTGDMEPDFSTVTTGG